MHDIGGIEFQKMQTISLSTVKVAIIDSGVDASHEDLSGKVEKAFRLSSHRTDGKAIIRRIDTGTNNDVANHGTAVAGIIARIAPNVVIHDYRVLNQNCEGKGNVTVRAFEAAIASEADIINMSLACRNEFRTRLYDLCEYAVHAGKLIIASQWNFSDDGELGLPAEFSSCIGVGIGMHRDPFVLEYIPESPIEFLAAGEGIPCLRMGGGYEKRYGTSMAAPHVSGLSALLLGKFPTLTPFEVKALLRSYAEHGTSLGWEYCFHGCKLPTIP